MPTPMLRFVPTRRARPAARAALLTRHRLIAATAALLVCLLGLPVLAADDLEEPILEAPAGEAPAMEEPVLEEPAEPSPTPIAASSGGCLETQRILIRTSPQRPVPGRTMKVMAIAVDGPLEGLRVRDAAATREPMTLDGKARGGPPWSYTASVTPSTAGGLRIEALRGDEAVSCRVIDVGASNRVSSPNGWDAAAEAYFAAWVEQLFDAPLQQDLSFPSLEPALRNQERNFLYDHYGQGEDDRLPAEPDCADLPYFLRAYFAWKVGLPVAYRACGRGGGGSPPRCGGPTIVTDFAQGATSLGAFNSVARKLRDTVHSGSARTGLADNASDWYPVPLEREALWPGTLYADPYGHVLMTVGWVDQQPGKPGMLMAVDAQPDNSVGRKRFWEGTFLFARTPSAGPGFKAFRPLLRRGGGYGQLGNGELAESRDYAPYSMQQASLDQDEFYARMSALTNPKGQDPTEAQNAMIDALVEQVETRVTAVENGEKYHRQHGGSVIPMPSGPAIFETIGAWEDYSTPSRDMRLVIALNVLENLPDRVRRYPEMFRLDAGAAEQVAEELRDRLQGQLRQRSVRYKRSDGSEWPLTLADIYARRAAFEVGYNPNECAEARWGAASGSDEAATCRRRAPADQRKRMEDYRDWFHEARRPSR